MTAKDVDNDGIGEKVARFVDRLQSIDRLLPLRTVPLPIDASYTPVRKRTQDGLGRILENQDRALACWDREIEDRFAPEERSRPVWANMLGHRASGAGS